MQIFLILPLLQPSCSPLYNATSSEAVDARYLGIYFTTADSILVPERNYDGFISIRMVQMVCSEIVKFQHPHHFKKCLIDVSFCWSIPSHPVQVLVDPPAPEPDVKECTKAGLMCETCTTSVMCVKIADKFIKTNRQNCKDGNSCYGGLCTTDVNPACDYANLDFPCQYQGAYPHPGDWTKYIFCIPNSDATALDAYTLNCEPGTGYNALTTYCSKNVSFIGDTTFPIDRCLEPSQTPIVLPSNPSIYYICAPYGDSNKLYPFQTACPSGGTYANGECTIILT